MPDACLVWVSRPVPPGVASMAKAGSWFISSHSHQASDIIWAVMIWRLSTLPPVNVCRIFILTLQFVRSLQIVNGGATIAESHIATVRRLSRCLLDGAGQPVACSIFSQPHPPSLLTTTKWRHQCRPAPLPYPNLQNAFSPRQLQMTVSHQLMYFII